MRDQTNLVRYRNDGDEFHVLWTARQAMRLLDPASNLKLVTIEGVAEDDKQAGKAGLLVVDTAEYYGADTLGSAQRVIYNQLKYSTRTPDEPWSASGLSETFKGFAELYRTRVKELGARQAKVTFKFVTNRQFSENVKQALEAAKVGKTIADLEGHVRAAYEALFGPTELLGADLQGFACLICLEGGARSLDGQSQHLEVEIKHVTPELDSGCVAKMKDLVRRKALSKATNDNGIDINELLFVFGLGNEDELLPCKPTFEILENVIPRAQEQAIVQKVLESQWPTIVQAGGGEGKSVLARRLGQQLPTGSEVVVFDGFAGGSYKDPRGYRHQHSAGLVHISNELARRALCNLLIKGYQVSVKSYLDAFYGRLEQAAAVVRARSPDAVVLVVIDAADNLGMAAAVAHEPCFVPDLLMEQAPDGCRIVALARTNRVADYLKPHHEVTKVDLALFSVSETTALLRQHFPDATDHDAHEFHRLTYGNPRVQANALAMADDVAGLLAAQTFGVSDTQSLIEYQLEKALAKVKHDHGATDEEFEPLCRALAALPPPIPIGVLSAVSKLNEVAIRGFVTDFARGRPITLVGNDAVQFRDEPVETWFQGKFLPDQEQYGKIADQMKFMVMTDGYVAAKLPLILNAAGRYDDLMKLALEGRIPENADPVQKREMVLNRVQYALRAALSRDSLVDAVKLALRAGEEVAATSRQTQFLMDNGDILSMLAGSSVVMDFVFRNRTWVGDRNAYVYCALMLAVAGESATEARRFLALSRLWLKDWAADVKTKRAAGRENFIERLEPEFIASFAEAILRLEGPAAMVDFASGWTDWFEYNVTLDFARRVLDRGEPDVLIKVLQEAIVAGSIPQSLAIILEMHRGGHSLPKREVAALVKGLLSGDKPQDLNYHNTTPVLAVVMTAEVALRLGMPENQIIMLLKRYPQPHAFKYRAHDASEREAVMRGAALLAELEGRKLEFEDIYSDEVRAAREKAAQEYADKIEEFKAKGLKPHEDGPRMTDTEKDFRTMFGPVIPWYVLRARAVLGRVSNWEQEFETAKKDTKVEKWRWRYEYELMGVLNEIGLIYLDALFWTGRATDTSVAAVGTWLTDQDGYISIATWTKMAWRTAQGGPTFHDASLGFATQAREDQDSTHQDARSTADTYVGLARAVFLVDKLEAQVLFQEALTKLDRLGDELYDRMQALLSLADSASADGTTNAFEAYRLGRMGELFHAYNDHKFPWADVILSVANLSPVSALANIARLYDRNVGHFGSMLSNTAEFLLEKKLITSSAFAALYALGDGWDLDRVAPHLFPTDVDASKNQAVLDMLLDDISKRAGGQQRLLKALISATAGRDLDTKCLAEMQAYIARLPDNESKNYDYLKDKPADPFTEKDWAEILDGIDVHSPSGIDLAQIRRRSPGIGSDSDVFMAGLRARVENIRRTEHIKALVRSEELTLDMIVSALEACNWEWGASSVAVKREVAVSTIYLLEARAVELLSHSWDFHELMDRCGVLTRQSKKEIFALLLRSLAENIHDVGARSLFFLVQVLANKLLTAGQAMEALAYGLDRVDIVTDADFGDGPWRSELEPDPDIAKALARFVYALLADPETALRWRAAHTVRRLCRFGETATIAELVTLLPVTELPAYRDPKLPFYEWHARLYLLIGLARAALETPEVLLPHAKAISDAAFKGPPHVLVHLFAAEAALALERHHPGTYSATDVAGLRTVNRSMFPTVPAKHESVASAKQQPEHHSERRFTFAYDFDRYWFEPLGEVFGVNQQEVMRRAEEWVMDKWHHTGKGTWDEEPRFKSEHSSQDTFATHGSYPKKDRLSFYLSYHAMFCAAGELLAELPIVIRYEPEPWERWLSGHTLTRDDGRWLYDRLSPIPLTFREWEISDTAFGDRDEWKFSVTANDLDSAIGFNGRESKSLAVWGDITINRFPRTEGIHVQSALVDQATSISLLRALQTEKDQHSYRLPLEEDDWEKGTAPFQLHGWIRDISIDRKLDLMDELAGDAPYPGPMPGKRLRRLFGLLPDDEQRAWSLASAVVVRSEIWGNWKSEDYGGNQSHGEIATITPDFLRTVLQKLKCDMVLKVEVTRTYEERENFNAEAYRYRGYTRIYIFRSDGTVHTLPGHRRLW